MESQVTWTEEILWSKTQEKYINVNPFLKWSVKVGFQEQGPD